MPNEELFSSYSGWSTKDEIGFVQSVANKCNAAILFGYGAAYIANRSRLTILKDYLATMKLRVRWMDPKNGLSINRAEVEEWVKAEIAREEQKETVK